MAIGFLASTLCRPEEVAMVEAWTVETVADRFVDAARTARRLPRVMVQGYPCRW
jgi:hypothetical protein